MHLTNPTFQKFGPCFARFVIFSVVLINIRGRGGKIGFCLGDRNPRYTTEKYTIIKMSVTVIYAECPLFELHCPVHVLLLMFTLITPCFSLHFLIDLSWKVTWFQSTFSLISSHKVFTFVCVFVVLGKCRSKKPLKNVQSDDLEIFCDVFLSNNMGQGHIHFIYFFSGSELLQWTGNRFRVSPPTRAQI